MIRFVYLLLFVGSIFSCTPNKTKVKIVEKPQFNARIGSITDFRTIHFPSKDGLEITADLYLVNEPKDFILLCHQAGFSRGEYIETAKKLNKMGFSCMAIDQRSGKEANHVVNETAKLAKEKGLKATYLDAKQDIEAAIDYAYQLNDSKAIILVGSSYSASLVLLLATTNNNVKAVAAFSPGEYLKGVQVAQSISKLNKPLFVTSAKKESNGVAKLVAQIKTPIKVHFIPKVEGIHGSRALWKSTKGNQMYWEAFTNWLNQIK